MTLDGFIRDAKGERVAGPQRVEYADKAVKAVEGFMERMWTVKASELTERSFGLRVHDGYQTPFVRLRDGNEAAIRRLTTIEDEEYQLVAKTEDTDDPNYEGETYARIPALKSGEAVEDASIGYADGIGTANVHVALALDEEVVETFEQIVDTLGREHAELRPPVNPVRAPLA